MAKTNRNCNYCGKAYYVCKSCVGKDSYKNVCCSVECFNQLFHNYMDEGLPNPIIIDKGETDMTGRLWSGEEHRILGFDIDNGKFDCEDGLTRSCLDFKDFILSYEEIKALRDNH